LKWEFANMTVLMLLKIVCYSVSKFVQWIKPEPLTVTVRQVLVFGGFVVLTAVVSFYGGWRSFEHSAKEKLMVREGVAAEARAEREDQDKKNALERAEQAKKFAQERQNFEMKIAQEREDQRKQFAQKQNELFDQAFSSTPRESQ
jgi:DNA integrity scanning protein DisA with diadenylate cyclase activity